MDNQKEKEFYSIIINRAKNTFKNWTSTGLTVDQFIDEIDKRDDPHGLELKASVALFLLFAPVCATKIINFLKTHYAFTQENPFSYDIYIDKDEDETYLYPSICIELKDPNLIEYEIYINSELSEDELIEWLKWIGLEKLYISDNCFKKWVNVSVCSPKLNLLIQENTFVEVGKQLIKYFSREYDA